MSRKVIGLTLVAASAVLALAAYLSSHKQSDLPHGSQPASKLNPTPEIKTIGMDAPRSGWSTRSAPLDTARTYSQLRTALSRSHLDRAQQLSYLYTAAYLCSDLEVPRPIRSESQKKSRDFLLTFCDTKSVDLNEIELSILEEGDSDVVLAKTLAGLAGEPMSSEAREMAEGIALGSENPSAFMDAVTALSEQPESNEWQLGMEVAQNQDERRKLPAARYLASQLVACDLSGGCESNGLYAQIMCRSTNMCDQRLSVSKMIQNTSSPSDWEFIQKIYNHIKDMRSTQSAM